MPKYKIVKLPEEEGKEDVQLEVYLRVNDDDGALELVTEDKEGDDWVIAELTAEGALRRIPLYSKYVMGLQLDPDTNHIRCID